MRIPLLAVVLNGALLMTVQAIGRAPEHICQRAAVFTPHPLVDSENTRYLFGIVSALQMIWCEYIDVLVTADNPCQTDSCFKTGPLAQKYLQHKGTYTPRVHVVSAPPGDPDLHPADDPGALLNDKYDVFVLVASEKLPSHRGIGSGINFFVCDFPFDVDTMQSEDKIAYLSSYDGVITSSFYSHSWYTWYTRPYFLRARNRGFMLPDIHTVLPPVPWLKKPKDVPHFQALNNTIYISFFGDFFPGENNNGHDVALTLLGRLQKDFPYAHLHLYMLGMVSTMPESDDYVNALKDRASSERLDVEFIVNPSLDQNSNTIGKSLLFWDMGGVHLAGRADPTVGALFDSAVVQAMAVGCIVIAQDHGVAPEIIRHNKHGFLASSINDYYKYSVKVLHSTLSDLSTMRAEAAKRAVVFDPFQHITKLATQFKSSIVLEKLHKLVAPYTSTIRTVKVSAAEAGTTDRMAAIILTGFQTSTEFVVRQTMRKLGDSWQLGLWVTELNADFYREIFADIPNIQYQMLPKHLHGDSFAESVLLKSMAFWDVISAKKVLVFDSNSLIVNPSIDAFMDYDFIGSPVAVVEGKSKSLGYSGSCSLRSVDAMKAVITECGPGAGLSEDDAAFFLSCAKKKKLQFKLPAAQTAGDFAVGSGYPKLKYYHTPVCLNKPWESLHNYKESDIQRWMEQAVDDLAVQE